MRSRILPAVGVSVVALVAAASFAGTSANASTTHGSAAFHAGGVQQTIAAKGKSCYSLTTNDTGVAIASQTATDDPGVNSYGATDFSVKKSCTIKSVQTVGAYYNGAGPADSLHVTIYKNKKGMPGKVVADRDNLKYTDSSGLGSLGAKLKTIKLKKGSYWLSVSVNMDLSPGGQWGWELSSDTNGAADLFENSGGEFGVCPTWDTVLNCTGYGNDYMVTLG